jgi:hypothetical protein
LAKQSAANFHAFQLLEGPLDYGEPGQKDKFIKS